MKRALPLLLLVGLRPAVAGNCRLLDVDLTTAESANNYDFGPQIVAWLEDTNGTFVDTVFVTRATGTYGIGNRPGRFDFKSGPLWPYGRRTTVFPVWSHKQPLEWPMLVFRDGDDNDLSHDSDVSSTDRWFCRPLKPSEGNWDTLTCPSPQSTKTDKGSPHASMMVRYPPRNDLTRLPEDDSIVDMFDLMNPFDAVSMATPAAGVPSTLGYMVPFEVPPGEYVLMVEVSKEFDMNATYNATSFPPPSGLPWNMYGEPYRGQPSVLYRVPFTLSSDRTVASTDTYIGYGDPEGLDGNIRAPDATISSDPGSGSSRLAITTDGDQMFRVRVTSRQELDPGPPDAPRELAVTAVTASDATISLVAPGDDGLEGQIRGYEVRFLVGETITDANFETAETFGHASTIPITASGQPATFTIENLLPETTYSVGIRAFDDCRNTGPVASVDVLTEERPLGQVDACFVATAAYGSLMANDVEALRSFRDRMLRKSVLGELAVETYYTFGPLLAGVIAESEILRHSARDALAPIVKRVSPLGR